MKSTLRGEWSIKVVQRITKHEHFEIFLNRQTAQRLWNSSINI